MTGISLRLPEDLESKLDKEAEIEGKARSQVIREALADYLTRKERERLMAGVVQAAEALANSRAARDEAARVAEDFLPLENEALDGAESSGKDEAETPAANERWWK